METSSMRDSKLPLSEMHQMQQCQTMFSVVFSLLAHDKVASSTANVR